MTSTGVIGPLGDAAQVDRPETVTVVDGRRRPGLGQREPVLAGFRAMITAARIIGTYSRVSRGR